MHPNPNRQLDLRKFAIYGICYPEYKRVPRAASPRYI